MGRINRQGNREDRQSNTTKHTVALTDSKHRATDSTQQHKHTDTQPQTQHHAHANTYPGVDDGELRL